MIIYHSTYIDIKASVVCKHLDYVQDIVKGKPGQQVQGRHQISESCKEQIFYNTTAIMIRPNDANLVRIQVSLHVMSGTLVVKNTWALLQKFSEN